MVGAGSHVERYSRSSISMRKCDRMEQRKKKRSHGPEGQRKHLQPRGFPVDFIILDNVDK